MHTTTMREAVWMEAAWPNARLWQKVLMAASVSVLTGLSARLALPLPFTPVPITGQTFVVLWSAALLGSRWAALAQLLYLLQGAAGLPVFSPSGALGVTHLLGPTGGYLLSYVPVAFVVGWLAERGWGKNFWTAVSAMIVGNLLIYLLGVVWLQAVLRLGFSRAVLLGAVPFMPGDWFKIVLAAWLLPVGWRWLERLQNRL